MEGLTFSSSRSANSLSTAAATSKSPNLRLGVRFRRPLPDAETLRLDSFTGGGPPLNRTMGDELSLLFPEFGAKRPLLEALKMSEIGGGAKGSSSGGRTWA